MVSLKMQEVLLSGAECLFDINIQCTFTQTRNTDSYDYFFLLECKEEYAKRFSRIENNLTQIQTEGHC